MRSLLRLVADYYRSNQDRRYCREQHKQDSLPDVRDPLGLTVM